MSILDHPVDGASEATTSLEESSATDDRLLEEDLIIEEISIDGMCGVY